MDGAQALSEIEQSVFDALNGVDDPEEALQRIRAIADKTLASWGEYPEGWTGHSNA